MSLDGTLDVFGVADLVLLLGQTRKTGVLELTPAKGAAGAVQLVKGSVVSVTSDVGRQRLARRLLGAGLATAEHLGQAVGDTPQGISLVPALAKRARIGSAHLIAVAEDLAVDELAELLSWKKGTFTFSAGDNGSPAGPDASGLSMAATGLVAAARARGTSRKDAVAVRVDREAVLGLAPLTHPVTLTPGEWQLLSLVDGHRTAAQVVAESGRDVAGVGALAELLARGLLRTAPDVGDHEPVEQLFSAREVEGTSLTTESSEHEAITKVRRVPSEAGHRVGLLDVEAPAPEVLPADPVIDEAMLSRLLVGIRDL